MFVYYCCIPKQRIYHLLHFYLFVFPVTTSTKDQSHSKTLIFPFTVPYTDFKVFVSLCLTLTYLIRDRYRSNRSIIVKIFIFCFCVFSVSTIVVRRVWAHSFDFNGGGPQRCEWLQFGGWRNWRLQTRWISRGSDWRYFQKWVLCGSEQAWLGAFFHCLARLGYSQIGLYPFHSLCFLGLKN